MKSAAAARRIIDALGELYPDATTELTFRTPFELLVATMLSAQSTDARVNMVTPALFARFLDRPPLARVNMVTPALFARFPDAPALARAATAELEALILSTGFFRQKARSLVAMATLLVEHHGGQVPADMDALTALPGVGRKTANVVLGHALGVPGLPVDRHVLRVANRIGLGEGDDPVAVESQLCLRLPKDTWTLASDVLILHGRRVCKPKPLCDTCPLPPNDCQYFAAEAAEPARAKKPRAKKR